jgi:hypothetical protein
MVSITIELVISTEHILILCLGVIYLKVNVVNFTHIYRGRRRLSLIQRVLLFLTIACMCTRNHQVKFILHSVKLINYAFLGIVIPILIWSRIISFSHIDRWSTLNIAIITPYSWWLIKRCLDRPVKVWVILVLIWNSTVRVDVLRVIKRWWTSYHFICSKNVLFLSIEAIKVPAHATKVILLRLSLSSLPNYVICFVTLILVS